MAYAAITTQIHEPFDVHGYFPPQVAFHFVLAYFCSNGIELRLIQIFNLGMRVDAQRS
jgi:hypothetical protein